MEIKLLRASVDDAKELHAMQIESFKELLEKYQDFDTSPGNESVEKVETRLKQDFTYYYFICTGVRKVGAIRIVDKKEEGINKRISPLFVLPEFQGLGIAQEAIRLCEEIHGSKNWELDTILQESKNCHLYEKMGYQQTGKTEVINERLTLVFYEKIIHDVDFSGKN
ncbi:MAG: GNAT family N-acetyltransferase [Lachnospiraceae bacterium]|nr:GNAT family N-acetyltransferase [Lachnospiraceae bacterium]